MKLGWYINRLRSMEPAEVVHRLHEKARKIASRRSHQGWSRYPAAPLHTVFPSLRASIQSAGPAQRQSIATAANTILSGHFSALGRDWPPRTGGDLFPASLWQLDPVTGTAWPDASTYAFDIDFRHDGARGDIKYVWELNRLQFLPPLAAFWLQTNQPQALAATDAAIGSWYSANPPFGGVAWASGIEVALRAISLIVTLDLLGDALAPTTRQQIAQILAASAFWLHRFPSRFSSANNHLVAELAGEYLIDLALGKPSSNDQLQRELSLQILPDGTGAEQTPTYAAFTAEMVLLCTIAARDAGQPFTTASTERLAAFADFIAWLCPIGFGDDDEGRVFALAHETDYPASIAAAINAVLQRPGLSAAGDDFRALVFGASTENVAAPTGLKTFTDGGISLWHGQMAARNVDLAFDHGPLGYLSIAAHGHADALALTLSIDGQPVLVDPGTWLYGSGGVWRNWFRSTPAHNTLNIDGASQSVIAGAFNWSHKAVASLLQQTSGPNWSLEAEHDGYQRRFGVLHRRRLARVGDAIEIIDRLIGQEREAELAFQLAAELTAVRDANVVTIQRDGSPILAIAFPDANVEMTTGGDVPGQGGWASPRFGERLPAIRLAWRGTIGANGVRTRLTLLPHQQH